MNARTRPLVALALGGAAIALAAATCQKGPSGENARLRKVEGVVAQVSGTTARLDQQLGTLEKDLQGKDEGMAGELAALRGSIDELRGSLTALQKDLAAARAADATTQKKLDELSSKVSGIDQRLWLLQTRYDDHLRKYHGGG